MRVLGVIDVFRFLLGIEVVEVAEELVEAVDGRQELIAVAEVVLAVLERHIVIIFQQLGDRRVFFLQAERRARQANLRQAGAKWRLSGDERRATCGARLLAVIVGEQRTLARNTVNVGRPIAHHALVVSADIPIPDVVGHDYENVWWTSSAPDLLC